MRIDRAVALGGQAANFAGLVRNQPQRRGRQQEADAALADVVLDHAEQPHTGRAVDRHITRYERVGRGCVEPGDLLDTDVAERLGPRERVVAVRLPPVDDGAACLGDLVEIGGHLLHAHRQRAQHAVRRRAVVRRLEMLETLLRVIDDPHVAARRDGDAARVRHLLQDQHTGAGIVRFDRSDRSGVAIADHDDIGGILPSVGHGAGRHTLRGHGRYPWV